MNNTHVYISIFIGILFLLSSCRTPIEKGVKWIEKAQKEAPELFGEQVDTIYRDTVYQLATPLIKIDTFFETLVDSFFIDTAGVATKVVYQKVEGKVKWRVKTVIKERIVEIPGKTVYIVTDRECIPVVVYKIPLWYWVAMVISIMAIGVLLYRDFRRIGK